MGDDGGDYECARRVSIIMCKSVQGLDVTRVRFTAVSQCPRPFSFSTACLELAVPITPLSLSLLSTSHTGPTGLPFVPISSFPFLFDIKSLSPPLFFSFFLELIQQTNHPLSLFSSPTKKTTIFIFLLTLRRLLQYMLALSGKHG